AAICAGPMVLTKAGVLSGKRAVCYPGLEDRMSGNMSQDNNTVTDGAVTTSRAAGSAIDFGLRLLAELKGESEAERVRAEIHHAE
ncbi:MAG: DJ-1/PfpI family protein, partial [Oscillospiraceae bacterium]|nr:DJ-1/PfpI family protein [Oscillospiraceae bacterium]